MAIEITINSITSGASPYNIYVCDFCSGGTCQLIGSITGATYTFTLPTVYESYSSYFVKVIDNNGCIYCEEFSTFYKQFQNGDFFEFMNGDEYGFQ